MSLTDAQKHMITPAQVWCMQGMHFVEKDKMTHMHSKPFHRLCEDCKKVKLEHLQKAKIKI